MFSLTVTSKLTTILLICHFETTFTVSLIITQASNQEREQSLAVVCTETSYGLQLAPVYL